ncbi:hypothetical protein BJ742DRAFT_767029 [Cladochytrium replicatum]|nr:hypothetical protein BJ742DRAFT_767029 [Cladochytrium replicatum]
MLQRYALERSAPRRFEETGKFAASADGVKTKSNWCETCLPQVPTPPSLKLVDTPRSQLKKSPRVSKAKCPAPPSKPGFVRGQRSGWSNYGCRSAYFGLVHLLVIKRVPSTRMIWVKSPKTSLRHPCNGRDEPDREPTPDAGELDEESEYDYVAIQTHLHGVDPVLAKYPNNSSPKKSPPTPPNRNSHQTHPDPITRRPPQHPRRPRESPLFDRICLRQRVGKSTNLSEVAFWLLMNKLRVLVAATLGAGAVELYEKGYGKDSAAIAKEAIAYAAYRFDMVLVDTAGRMQDNEMANITLDTSYSISTQS